jgi:hypothetical protein
MSEAKDKAKEALAAPVAKRSGRAGFDERGNSVWEWQLETGVYSRDVSTQKLKKLELGDLSTAETAVNEADRSGRRTEGRGRPGRLQSVRQRIRVTRPRLEPYDSAASSGASRWPGKPSATPARKPVDLKKLEEWMQAKRDADENREDD